jgi:hypothetical protein
MRMIRKNSLISIDKGFDIILTLDSPSDISRVRITTGNAQFPLYIGHDTP